MWSIVPANIAIFLIWGAVPGILLPQQITLAFGEENQINVANLAIVIDDRRLRRDDRPADRRADLRPHAVALRPPCARGS